MGNEAAARDIAPGSTTSTSSTTSAQSAGKTSLAQQQPPTTDAEMIAEIEHYAGEVVPDGSGFEFTAKADGTFDCTTAPPESQSALHQPMTPTVRRNAWLVLGGKLHDKHPEPLPKAAPQPAPQPAPDPNAAKLDAKPLVEPSLVARASEVVREECSSIADGASSLFHRMINALGGGGDAPAPVPATAPAAAPTSAPQPAAATPASAPPSLPVSGDIPANYRAKDSWSSDPLAAALTRTTGDFAGNTSYTTTGKGLYGEMASGKADQKRFFCDGFQIWALAASGYNMLAPILAADGKAITGQKYKHDGDKQVPDGPAYTPCLYDLINGDGRAVETVMAAGDMSKGGVFEIHGTGFLTPHDGAELPTAMRGAPGAFVATGLGTQVAEVDQLPGDFVQARWPSAAKDDPEMKQRGDGHAWIVDDVYANGSAWFGAPASPKQTSGGQLSGWQVGVNFIIEKDTDPRLVGKHTALGAQRCEANVRRATENKDVPGVDDGKDGGAQVTGFHLLSEQGEPGTVRFVGRLGTSKWNGWKEASPESAALAAQLGADTPTPLPATPRTDPPKADAPEAQPNAGDSAAA